MTTPHGRTRRGSLSLTAALIGIIAASCSGPRPTARPIDPDVTLVARYGLGPQRYLNPSTLAQTSGALGCHAWILGPVSPGGASIEVHLKLAAVNTASARSVLYAAGAATVDTSPATAFAAAPQPRLASLPDGGAATAMTWTAMAC